jgi:hypothetical protein
VSLLTGVLVAIAALTACSAEVLRLREWHGQHAPFVPFRDLRRSTGAVVLSFAAIVALVGTWATSTSEGNFVPVGIVAVALALAPGFIAVAVHNARADRGTPTRAS